MWKQEVIGSKVKALLAILFFLLRIFYVNHKNHLPSFFQIHRVSTQQVN